MVALHVENQNHFFGVRNTDTVTGRGAALDVVCLKSGGEGDFEKEATLGCAAELAVEP